MAAVSYDLFVFSAEALSNADLGALICGTRGFAVGEATDGSVTVVRGARRRYCFTIEGPEQIEAEDVPADVARKVLGSRWRYSVMVEGSAQAEVPYAARFAKTLARALDGAAFDQQTDQVWSQSQSRVVQPPQRQSRVVAVDVDWHCLRRDVHEHAPQLFLETVERHLPEALPRRFGEYEPFQAKYAESGPDGFVRAWAEAASTLYFSGSGLCVAGSLDAGPNDAFPDSFWSMSLTLLAEPLQKQGWRDALRRVLIALTDGLPAFHAAATVTRGHLWSGRSLTADAETEWAITTLRRHDGWMGLSPVPTWWTWLGGPYRDAASLLPAGQTTPTAAGVLFEAATNPAPADSLEPPTRWLNPDLFATLGPNPHDELPIPLVPAISIPAPLT